MDHRTYICPRCGAHLRFDADTGRLWCASADCGFVVHPDADGRKEGQRGTNTDDGASPVDLPPFAVEDGEWIPEPRSRRRTVFIGLVVVATAAAVVAMALGPLIWPARPYLSVTPGEIRFDDQTGTGVMPQALAIQNQGKGRLDWEASTDVPWLTIDPPSGTIESGLQILTVKANTMALTEGTHSATFSVTAVGAQNSPQVIAVQVQLASPPEARAIRELLGDNVDVHYGIQPPYVSGPIGVPIELAHGEDATDVTWNELVEFLRQDATDESPYIQDLYMCGTFSELLHNSAEAAGIRAAWVSLDISGRDIGHALNAFFTTDRGLVFVDCTGGDTSAVVPPEFKSVPCDHDRVAYVKPGTEYGLISIDRAESPAYEFYETYSAAWSAYVADLEEYNRLAIEYNAFVTDRVLIAGSADARQAQALHSQLQSQRVSLDLQREVLGDCRWQSLGIVDRVRVYW